MKNVKELGCLITACFIAFSCSSQDYEKYTLKELNLIGPVKSFTTKTTKNGGNITEIYSFDEKGNLIEMNNEYSNITINGKPSRNKEIYKYNDKGVLTSKNLYAHSGAIIETCTFKHDKHGNRIEALTIEQPSGNPYNKYSNIFDENGNLIAYYFVHLKYGNKSKWIFKYDEKGHKIESKDYNDDGRFEGKRTFEYNDKEDVVAENFYNTKNQFDFVIKYKYEYDSIGNWIKKMTFFSSSKPDSPSEILERQIEYGANSKMHPTVNIDKVHNENNVDSSQSKYLRMLNEAYERSLFDIRVSHIFINLSNNGDTLKAYKKISAIREKILAGENFEKLAVKYSDDQSVSDHKDQQGQVINGNLGDMGYFTVFNKVYAFENAAYNTEVGKISPIVRTQYGYHLIKVTDKRKSDVKGTFQENKASLQEKLLVDPRCVLLIN